MIDPKINLRISPRTDLDLLSLASELTRKGWAFRSTRTMMWSSRRWWRMATIWKTRAITPVAACWEFLIPGRGMEVVNIGAVSFPAAVDRAIREGCATGDDIDGILTRVRQDIAPAGCRPGRSL